MVIEECDGGILSIRVTKCGSGFRELPEVYINTQTGLNAFLIPVMKFHKENFDEFPEGTTFACSCCSTGKVPSTEDELDYEWKSFFWRVYLTPGEEENY